MERALASDAAKGFTLGLCYAAVVISAFVTGLIMKFKPKGKGVVAVDYFLVIYGISIAVYNCFVIYRWNLDPQYVCENLNRFGSFLNNACLTLNITLVNFKVKAITGTFQSAGDRPTAFNANSTFDRFILCILSSTLACAILNMIATYTYTDEGKCTSPLLQMTAAYYVLTVLVLNITFGYIIVRAIVMYKIMRKELSNERSKRDAALDRFFWFSQVCVLATLIISPFCLIQIIKYAKTDYDMVIMFSVSDLLTNYCLLVVSVKVNVVYKWLFGTDPNVTWNAQTEVSGQQKMSSAGSTSS